MPWTNQGNGGGPGAPEVAMGVLEMAVMDHRGAGKVGEVDLRGQILKICCDVVRTGYVPCFPKIWVAKGLVSCC